METNESHRDAAYDFLKSVGLEPNPDAIGQLSGPFTDALAIICERGYTRPEEDGATFFWQLRGWKGLVHDIIDNALRLELFSWDRNEFYENGAVDIINFAGFYLRLKNEGKKWGRLKDPA